MVNPDDDPEGGPDSPGAADARKWALGAILGSSVGIGVAYASAFLRGGVPPWAPWLFLVAVSAMMVATMALGAAKTGSLGRLRIPFALLFLLLTVGFGLALVLPPVDPTAPVLWFGLPPGAAIVVYGIGLLPYLIVPVAYAWTFDDQAFEEGALERVREAALRARKSSSP